MRLFVFEGSKREIVFFETIRELFFKEINNDLIVCSFKNNIYNLYKRMQESAFTEDILSVLKDVWKNSPNNPIHNIVRMSDVSEVFLFFDYDGHNNKRQNYTNNVLKDMLKFFSNETENGKLYISYPMIEALCYTKKLPDNNYVDYVIYLDECKEFKNIVSTFSGYKNFDFISFRLNKYGSGVYVNSAKCPVLKQNWQYIIEQNVTKANAICNDKKVMPSNNDDITQEKIFISQEQKYIQNNKLAILASYPLFLFEYFGIKVNCIS
ncbi:MAG: hypothetical protein ACTTKH_04240 [Treponema sp.]